MLCQDLFLAMIVKTLDSRLSNFPLDYKCRRERHAVIPKLAHDVRVIEEIPVVGILKLQFVICQKVQELFTLLRRALACSLEACAIAHIEILEIAQRELIGADFENNLIIVFGSTPRQYKYGYHEGCERPAHCFHRRTSFRLRIKRLELAVMELTV